METKKLSRLKKLVAVMLTLNTIVCLGMDVATVTAAYGGEIVLMIGCFVAALFNAVAVWLLIPLHDAMTEELEERQEKLQKNNIVVLFPARALYDINAYEEKRERIEAN